MGHFKKLARDRFFNRKGTEMKFFDFGVFQKNMEMLSREKIIFHMLFGASHGTPRMFISGNWVHIRLMFESEVEIFDSLGFNVLNWPRIPTRLLSFLHRLAIFKKVYCSKRLQPEFSTLCGFYCIFYVKFRPFFPFSFLENIFTAKLESNDLKLLKIFK